MLEKGEIPDYQEYQIVLNIRRRVWNQPSVQAWKIKKSNEKGKGERTLKNLKKAAAARFEPVTEELGRLCF